MRRWAILVLILVCVSALVSDPLFSQPKNLDLEDVYQKPPTGKSWGDIFSWIYSKQDFRKSYALVIGIGDYTSRDWLKLEAPYYDAIRVRDFLIQDEGFDYVVTLTNARATKEKINTLMEETFPGFLKKDDRFFFYFSGHGTQRMVGGVPKGYLPMQNSGKKTFGNMISMAEIERWDKLIAETRHVLYVMDCCFSGLAGQQRKSPLTDKTLSRLSQYAHHLVTAGTANEESVGSLEKWRGSLFTDAFLRGISGRADVSYSEYEADGVVSLKELLDYIGRRIDAETVKIISAPSFAKAIKMSPQISDLQENAGEFFFITRNTRNLKVGNTPDADLSYGLPVEFKSQPKAPFFRPTPKDLSVDQVKFMLQEQKCYERAWNPSGPGFDNQFESQTIRGDKVMIDHASGLMWQQGGSENYMTFSEAEKWIRDLKSRGYAGFYDWRLPTLEEAMSLMEREKLNGDLYIDPRFDPKQEWIWTSDPFSGEFGRVWVVFFSNGLCSHYIVYYYYYVRAVRSGQSSP